MAIEPTDLMIIAFLSGVANNLSKPFADWLIEKLRHHKRKYENIYDNLRNGN